MMREIVEGTSQEAPHDVVETLQNAMSRRTSTTNGFIGGEPKAGPEGNKPGAPRQSRLVSLVMARNGGTKPKSGGVPRISASSVVPQPVEMFLHVLNLRALALALACMTWAHLFENTSIRRMPAWTKMPRQG
jgi:hypothetical protein